MALHVYSRLLRTCSIFFLQVFCLWCFFPLNHIRVRKCVFRTLKFIMAVKLMSSAYPCVPVKMERANINYSAWEKCIYSLAKKSKVNFEKHFFEITILRENFSADFLYIYFLEQLRGRRGKQIPHTKVFVQQNREKHILEACFIPSTFTDSVVLL